MNATQEERLAKEISELKKRLESLASSDEFCYMKDVLTKLRQEQKEMMKEFRIRNTLLQILNQQIKKLINGRSINPIIACIKAEKVTNILFNEIRKAFDQTPEAIPICVQYLDHLGEHENYPETRKLVSADIADIRRKIADNNEKQSRLINGFEAKRREILKLIKEKENELRIIRQSLRIQKEIVPTNHQPPTASPSSFPPHRRKKAKDHKEVEVPQSPPEVPIRWEFRLVFDDKEGGVPMPSKRREFVKILEGKLKEEKVFGLNCHSLYDKILDMGKVDPAQRPQFMNKISGDGLCHGWYKLYSGQHRVLLDFDDKARIIKFLPADHGIYEKIWHSS